jgi:hypothetical protein
MKRSTLVYIILASVVAVILGLVIWTIYKNDPYAETVEAACYPDLVKTWRKEQPGNHLYVTCMDSKGNATKEVEVKHKPGM